jgi:hypothetical protein
VAGSQGRREFIHENRCYLNVGRRAGGSSRSSKGKAPVIQTRTVVKQGTTYRV